MTWMNAYSTWVGLGGYLVGGQIAEEVPAKPANTTVEEGPKTSQQLRSRPDMDGYGFSGGVDCCGPMLATKGAFCRRLGSNYSSYRRMRADGIVAIGREIADSLVCIEPWTYEGRDETVKPEWVDLIKNTWEGFGGMGKSHQGLTLREFMLSESCRAKDYGNATLERVWGENEQRQTTVVEMNPLLPERTRPLVVQGTRTFAGVRNWGLNGAEVDLDPQYCVRFVYDSEGGDFFGRSRFENIMEWIDLKWFIRGKMRQDANIAIGNQMQVFYPADKAGEKTNETSARYILKALTNGQGIIAPDFSIAQKEAMSKNSMDPTKLRAWTIERLDTGTPSFDAFKTAIDLVDEQILFGMLVLPRSVKEAEHGAKADAEEHTDTMAMMAWRWITYVVGIANNITDDILEQNFGKEARGAVRVKPVPIDDASIAIIQQIMVTILSNNPDLAAKVLDIKANMEKLGLKMLPDFDQQQVAIAIAAKGKSDLLPASEQLKHIGYDEKDAKRLQDEKAREVPTDEDGLRGAPAAKGVAA